MELNDNSKVDAEVKKTEVMNNELMVDVKSELSSTVIPSKPDDEVAVDLPEDMFEVPSITNSEVGTFCIAFSTSLQLHSLRVLLERAVWEFPFPWFR